MENNKKLKELRRLRALAAACVVSASLVKTTNVSAEAGLSDIFGEKKVEYSVDNVSEFYNKLVTELVHWSTTLADNGINVSYQEMLGFDVNEDIAKDVLELINGKFSGNEEDMKKALFTIDIIISANMEMYKRHEDEYAIDLSQYVKDTQNAQYINDAFNKVKDVMHLINGEPLDGYIINVPGYDPCDPEDAAYINENFTSLSTGFKATVDKVLSWEYSLVSNYKNHLNNDGATLLAFEIMQQINNVIPQDSYYIGLDCNKQYLNSYVDTYGTKYYREGDYIYTCVNGSPVYYDLSLESSLTNNGIAGQINTTVDELKKNIAGKGYDELYDYNKKEETKKFFDENGNLIVVMGGIALALGAGYLLGKGKKDKKDSKKTEATTINTPVSNPVITPVVGVPVDEVKSTPVVDTSVNEEPVYTGKHLKKSL